MTSASRPLPRGKTTPASTAGSFTTYAHGPAEIDLFATGPTADPFGDDSWWQDPPTAAAEHQPSVPPASATATSLRNADPRDVLPLGSDSGLRTVDGDPILVTEHNRDLLVGLTQADIEGRTPAFAAALAEETRRLSSAIAPEDLTLPSDPGAEDIRRVAANVDAAFDDICPSLAPDAALPGPQPVLAQIYGTPDRALVAIGQAVAAIADARASGPAHGGAQAVEQRWLERVGSRSAEHTASGQDCKSADHIALEAGRDPQTLTALRAMSEAYRSALSEIRPLGGHFALHPGSSPRIAKVVESTTTVWPTDWLAASNASEIPLHIGTSIKRAHYSHGATAEIKGLAQPTTDYARKAWRGGALDGQNAWEPEYDAKASAKHKGPGRVYRFYRGLTDEELAKDGWDPKHSGRAVRETEWIVATDADFDSWSRATGRSVEDLRAGFEQVSDPDIDGGEPFWRKPHLRQTKVGTERVGQIQLSNDKVAADPTRDARYRPAVHELGHRMEYVVPNLNRMARAWRERRVAESPTEEGRALRPIYRGTRENGYSDHFVNHYMGRSYDHRRSVKRGVAHNFVEATEIFSMGSEALFAGSEGGLIGLSSTKEADPDMRAFVLGVFATAGMSRHR